MTSSEEDDDDDDTVPAVARRAIAAPAAAPAVATVATARLAQTATVAPVAVGIAIDSPARMAIERLEAALDAVDERSAPSSAQATIRRSKEALGGEANTAAIAAIKNGRRLNDASVNGMLAAMAAMAAQLAAIVARPMDVAHEIEQFRRAASAAHDVWSDTLPELERLANAAKKNAEAAAETDRAAARLLGQHAALSGSFASALEGLRAARD